VIYPKRARQETLALLYRCQRGRGMARPQPLEGPPPVPLGLGQRGDVAVERGVQSLRRVE